LSLFGFAFAVLPSCSVAQLQCLQCCLAAVLPSCSVA